jgi:hypothetical protein
MTNIVREEVTRIILSDRRHLELAFDVEEAMLGGVGRSMSDTGEGVHALLIQGIFQALEDQLRNRLGGGWDIEITPHTLWGSMTVRRPTWPKLRVNEKYPDPVPAQIFLGTTKGAMKNVVMAFQAWRFEFPDPGRSNLTGPLLQEMEPGAWSDDRWAAIKLLPSPLNDWSERSVLIDIGYPAYCARQGGGSPPWQITELGDRLVSMAQVADKAVPVEWSKTGS